jgi:hypothetical protein
VQSVLSTLALALSTLAFALALSTLALAFALSTRRSASSLCVLPKCGVVDRDGSIPKCHDGPNLSRDIEAVAAFECVIRMAVPRLLDFETNRR